MKFAAVLELHGKTATGITIPDQVIADLGGGGRPLVKVTLNGYTYRTAVGVMKGVSLIPVSAAVRAEAGLAPGDAVDVGVELDTEPGEVEVPAALQAALDAHPAAQQAFTKLSNSAKKRHTLAVEGAKTDETRARRVAKAIDELGG